MVHRSIPEVRRLAVIPVLLLVLACSLSPEAKKQRYLESGNQYLAQSKYREAAIEFRNAAQADPRSGEARLKLAEALFRLGDPANALSEYVRAADLLETDAAVQLKAGEYLLAAGRFDEALARADRALKIAPGKIEVHILRGNALAGTRDLDGAVAEIEEAIRLDPGRGVSFTNLGFVQSAKGRTAEAETSFRQAVALAPKEPAVHLALANFLWSAGKLSEAEQSFAAAWNLDPKNAHLNRVMAAFCLSTGRTADAEKYLLQMVQSSPGLATEFALTDYYIATSRSPEAIQRLEKMVAASPDVLEPKERLALAYMGGGDRARAHALLDDILKKNQTSPEAELLKGRLLAGDGKADEALARVQKAIQGDPKSIRAHYALGELYTARGDLAGADKAFREVLRLNPRAVAAQVQLSRLQLAQGNTAGSLQTAEAAAKNLPKNLEVRVALVRSLLASKNTNRADQEIDQLLIDYPNVASVHVLSGLLAADRKEPGARAKFEKALSLEPSSREAITALVVLDLQTRNFAAAKERVARLLSASASPDAETMVLAARVYATVGDVDQAEQLLRKAIEVKPTLLVAYDMLGRVYLARKQLDQARKEFDNVAARHSNPVPALTMSGMILEAQGNRAEARKRYEQALESDPRAGVSANNLAWLYLESGESLDMALQLAQAAVTAMPESPEVLDTLGWIYYKKNLPKLAIAPLGRAVEKQPDNPLYHYHLGLALAQAGDGSQARVSLERALRIDAKFTGADDAKKVLASLP
jgi:putative PEP-CTERM system TPR-repeat lipoprotein